MITIRLKLKEVLDSKKITRYELAKRTNIRYPIIDKYYKNRVIRYDSYVLAKICEAIDCNISDLLESYNS